MKKLDLIFNDLMSANIYSFYNDAFWSEKSKGKGYLPFEIFREQGNDKVGAIFGANATSLGFTTLLTDKCKGTVLTADGKPTEELVYSTYNLKQLNPKTNRVYLINEQTKAVDAQTPVSDSEKDNDLEFLQTPYGTNCSYIIDMFSIKALYKGNFEIIFYADNPYTNNKEDYLRLSVWNFRGKTKSVLNNYLWDMTTNYKTSFLLPHDYEIPTFNYPEYVLPPIPYQYKPYTKDIWDANTIQPLKTKITAPAQCKKKEKDRLDVNLFDDTAEYNCYYELEIDLKQLDPTIQSISKFQDAYKTFEISNLNNLQVSCSEPKIQWFILNRNVNINRGINNCSNNICSLTDFSVPRLEGLPQVDNVNFENTITLYTKNIEVNDIKTFYTAYTNGLPLNSYTNRYVDDKKRITMLFSLQITAWSNNINNKIKETYLQAYYTNDVKLKIIFSKTLLPKLLFGLLETTFNYFGNIQDIKLNVSNWATLGIKNNSNNPIKITFKPK